MSSAARFLINTRHILSAFAILASIAATIPFTALAADTPFANPSSNTNVGWDNPQNAYSSNNSRADADNDADVVEYGGFSFPNITGSVTGIEVEMEGYTDAPARGQVARQAQVSLSWDGGASYTSGASGLRTTNFPVSRFGASDTNREFGNASDKWGRTWTVAELSNLRVKLDATAAADGKKLHIDHVKVKVYYAVLTNTTTAITSDTPDPSNIGQAYTVNVSVAPSSGTTRPLGSMTVSDGAASCTDTSASSGSGASSVFSCSLTSTTAGAKTLTATYTSTNNFAGSSGTATHAVNGPTTPPPSGAFSKGMVSLSFDDGLKGHTMSANAAGGIMQSAGFIGTFYMISEDMTGATLFNPEYAEFMTKSEMLALAANGNEIGLHSRTHGCGGTTPCAGLTAPSADLVSEINAARSDLLSAPASPVNTFAYPFGMYNDTVIDQLKKAGVVGARTVDFISALGQATFNTPQTNPYKLAAVQINNATPVTATDAPLEWPVGTPRPEWGYVQKWIDDAIASNSWLILTFHNVLVDCAGDTDCISPDKLRSVTDYLASKGSTVSVVPVKNGLAQMGYPATATDTVAPTVKLNGLSSGGTVIKAATSGSGAPVTFTTTVSDNVSTGLTAFCVNPAATVEAEPGSGVFFPKIVRSGDVFPVGITKVNCSAADQHGNLGFATFNFFVTPQGF